MAFFPYFIKNFTELSWKSEVLCCLVSQGDPMGDWKRDWLVNQQGRRQVSLNETLLKICHIFWKTKTQYNNLIFQILWKSRCDILVTFYTKILIEDFFTRFTCEKTPQYNFSSQNFSVENNYFSNEMEK